MEMVEETRIGKGASKETLRLLVDGKLPWEEVKGLIRHHPKESDRFWKYLEVLQEKVCWKDKILLRVSDHLYIVAKVGGGRVVKCECGHEFGDYRVNWKFNALIRVRRTMEEFRQVYPIEPLLLNEKLVEIREYYCPQCAAQLSVEVLPPGYPPVFDMLPDLDAFYREWLGKPLPDEDPAWFQDKTAELLSGWREEQ